MRFLLAILLTALLAYVIGMFLPWWSVAIAAFLVALLLRHRPGRGFLAGFLGVFLLWFLLALVIDIQNNQILSQKIALVLPLGGSTFLLLLVTAFVGALVGAFAALAGSSVLAPVRRRR